MNQFPPAPITSEEDDIITAKIKNLDYTITDTFIQNVYDKLSTSLNNTTEFSIDDIIKLIDNIYQLFDNQFYPWFEVQICDDNITREKAACVIAFIPVFETYNFICYKSILRKIDFNVLEKLYNIAITVDDKTFIDQCNEYMIQNENTILNNDTYLYNKLNELKSIYLNRKYENNISNITSKIKQLTDKNTELKSRPGGEYYIAAKNRFEEELIKRKNKK